MLLDLVLKLAASLIAWILGFLPSFAVSGAFGGLADAWAAVSPIFALADYFAPVHEALAMLVSVLVLRGALVLWYAVNWLYCRIPVLGH